jgi:1-aminocyclopropane-1-carboxylate deaminase/D-cysteine desulfhydrase-like pyridoxal-dependent ACC family enzyme
LIDRFYSGNKARKFYKFLNSDLSVFDEIVSYGGAQSNAMLSLAKLSFDKKLQFRYFTKPLPSYLKENIEGNLKYALELGMKLIELEEFPNESEFSDKTLFIKQGGADLYSEDGFKLLAKEIEDEFKDFESVAIFMPSGTGIGAYYLAKHSKYRVYTTPCVANEKFLKDSFLDSKFEILDIDKKYHFGKLYREFYEIYKELKQETQIEFDMLYDSKGWLVLDRFRDMLEREIIYIHCGGIIGNETMLKRYKRKFSDI